MNNIQSSVREICGDTIPVSVIVPSYNSSRWLEICISSINSGTQPSEIIIIDDCSSDDSLKLAWKLAEKYHNIIVLKTNVNSGAAKARQLGFNIASNSLVAIVDSDDFLEEGALLDAFLKFTDDVDMCIWELWRNDKNDVRWKHSANPNVFPITGEEGVLMSLGEWRIHPLGIVRKELYLNAYENFSVDSFNSDELITRLILLKSRKIIGSTKKYYYRINEESTTQVVTDKHIMRMRSDYWLINFSLNLKDAPTASLVKNGIASAYGLWRKRKKYSKSKLTKELSLFVKNLNNTKNIYLYIIKNPKYVGALLFLTLISYFSRHSQDSAARD